MFGIKKQNKILITSLIFLSIIATETIAEFAIKENDITHKFIYLFIGCFLYAFIGFLFAIVLKFVRNIGRANAIWDGGAVAVISIASYVFFREKYNMEQKLGLVSIIIGLVLLI